MAHSLKQQHPADHTTAALQVDFALVAVAGLLITLYLTANIMAVKLLSFGGVTFFDAGTLTFPLAFMLGDVLTEVWGYTTARRVIVLAFCCNCILTAFTALGLVLPTPDYAQETAAAYGVIFGYVPRIVAASLTAFLVGEVANAWAMVRLRESTGGRHLWFRAIGSSALGYLLDTSLFVLLAFTGTAPWQDLCSMIGIQYVGKLLLESVFALPFTYLMVHWLGRRHP